MNFVIMNFEILEPLSFLPFAILAFISVVCAIGMIFNPNLVRAGFTLVGCFAAISGIYFLLSANFVAVSQVLIYAVGIVLVIVFAIMLCSLKEDAAVPSNDEETDLKDIKSRRILAAFVCLGLFILFTYVINSQDWSAIAHLSGAEVHLTMIDQIARNYTPQIGNLMLSKYVLPFELISVLLLMVLVGVIIISKKQITTETEGSK